MNYYLLILPLCCIIIIIILASKLKKKEKVLEKVIIEKHKIEVARKNELKDYFREEWNEQEYKLNNQIQSKRDAINFESAQLEADFKLQESEFINALKNLQIQLNEKEARYVEVNQDLDLYKQGKIKEIDSAAAEYEQRKQLIVDNSIDNYREIKNQDFEKFLSDLQRKIDLNQLEYEAIKKDLEEERTKRAAINEEIRRAREVEEQQDFYRIQLDPNDTEDVEILRSVAPRLRHPDAINKVIWTGYYQKPLAELRKRILVNGDVSGIYKITRLKTNEIYIGQTTSVDKRWQEHVKSALGVGTLASSQLHRARAADGCENFTFELLEVVPKDKLRERESYYIDFYDSKTYGLNSVSGDKNKN